MARPARKIPLQLRPSTQAAVSDPVAIIRSLLRYQIGSTVMQFERAHPDVALPAVVHRVASDIPAASRVLVIGDVHGCYDELQSLLQTCDFCAANGDRLAFVGDLVNKGPKSLDVLRFVRVSGALCVRGNHDDAALSAYYKWVQGGRAPGSAKYPYVENFEKEDVQFLEQLPFSVSLPNHDDVVVVHAGLVDGVPLEQQRPWDMYKMRFVQRQEGDEQWTALEKEKFRSERCGEPEKWAKVWSGPRHVYFGHAASAGLQREAFATGLDTGCCYGKKLTACIVPSDKLVQVDAKEQYAVP